MHLQTVLHHHPGCQVPKAKEIELDASVRLRQVGVSVTGSLVLHDHVGFRQFVLHDFGTGARGSLSSGVVLLDLQSDDLRPARQHQWAWRHPATFHAADPADRGRVHLGLIADGTTRGGRRPFFSNTRGTGSRARSRPRSRLRKAPVALAAWDRASQARAAPRVLPLRPGTCRMGHGPADSVVDLNLVVHGFDNLMVVDGSVMPVQVQSPHYPI